MTDLAYLSVFDRVIRILRASTWVEPISDAVGATRQNVTIGGFYGAPLRLPLSWLVQNAYEPDGDNIVLSESALQVMRLIQ